MSQVCQFEKVHHIVLNGPCTLAVVTSILLLDSSLAKSCLTNDRSEARVDPLAALLVQGKGQTGKYQAVVSRAT